MSVMQAELPNSQSNKIIQPLRALKNRQAAVPLGQGPSDGAPGASTRLCAYLNDMRELRTKQGELTAAFKACVPPAWWGTDAGFKSQLGDRFKMCQVHALKHCLGIFCIVATICTFLLADATVTRDCIGKQLWFRHHVVQYPLLCICKRAVARVKVHAVLGLCSVTPVAQCGHSCCGERRQLVIDKLHCRRRWT